MRKTLICILLVAILAMGGALAGASVNAVWVNGQIVVSWDQQACGGDAVLTVYRNGWPAMVQDVGCENGAYTVPSWVTDKAGVYTVRLRCANSCEIIGVKVKEDTQNTEKPVENPTPVPTQSPTKAPTVAPTIQPTVRPTARPTATTAPTANNAGSSSSSLASQVIALTNQERAASGLSALSYDAALAQAACVRAQEITQLFSHTRPDGSKWNTVSSQASGENIAKGYQSAERVMSAWMTSEGHKANILRESFTRIGVCAYTYQGVTYWVQLFGR